MYFWPCVNHFHPLHFKNSNVQFEFQLWGIVDTPGLLSPKTASTNRSKATTASPFSLEGTTAFLWRTRRHFRVHQGVSLLSEHLVSQIQIPCFLPSLQEVKTHNSLNGPVSKMFFQNSTGQHDFPVPGGQILAGYPRPGNNCGFLKWHFLAQTSLALVYMD